jgi:hypothetical protein
MVDETPSTYKADRNRVPSQITLLDGALLGVAQTFSATSHTLVAQLPPVAWRTAQKAFRILSSLAHIVSYQGGSAIQMRISYWR